jgi:putative acetyltransferase
MLRIVSVETEGALRETAALFREYAASLGIDLSFQDFDRELETLPGDYAPPAGRLFLAFVDDSNNASEAEGKQTGIISSAFSPSFNSSASAISAGCIALRKFGDDICEMKRLYIRPQFRGHGAGRALAEAVIQAAREIGYRSIRLDTLPQMTQAQALYRDLGFREIPPYRHNPVPGTRYFELAL